MASVVVGGIECALDDSHLTLGEVVIPLRDLVAFGVTRKPELVFAYERRGPDGNYRARAAARPVTMTMPAYGDVETLIALARQRVPHAWRGTLDTVDDIYGSHDRSAAPAPKRRMDFRRFITLVLVALAVSLFLSAAVLIAFTPKTDIDRVPTRPHADAGAPTRAR